MSERARILASSIAIMVTVSVCVVAVTLVILDRVSFRQHRDRLVQMVQHRARILEEVSAFATPFGAEQPPAAAEAARLRDILAVFATYGTFGETGELTLARREGNKIVWLVENGRAELKNPHTTPVGSHLTEPMRRALSGESGTLVGVDYRGQRALSAYESVPGLGWGVVAEMDVAEINRPFSRAALLGVVIAIALTALGVMVVLWVGSPLIGRIESRVAERTAQLSRALDDQKHLQEQLRSAASEAALAEERERRKLAVDLHDGLGQLLSASGMRLALLRDSIRDPGLVDEVQAVESVIAEADERVSSLSFELSPPLLHDVGLVAATQWLAEDIEARLGLHVIVEDPGERWPLDEAARTTLFRALRELLLNVSKHARTDEARVRFWREDRFLKILVEDEGVGFASKGESRGYGLLSIRERLNHLGWSIQIESAPGEGTRIYIAAPVEATGPTQAGEST
jgi:signal transduction histidine kinase